MQWVWDNRKPLLEMGLGITMMYGGEGIKRSGQFFGITIATSGSIGTAGLGSPVAVGAGLTVGVSATAVGNMVQASGAALLAEGSRNAKDAKKLDNKGADKLAQEKGYKDAHDLKKNYVGNNGGKYDIIKNAKTGQTFLIDKSGEILIPIED